MISTKHVMLALFALLLNVSAISPGIYLLTTSLMMIHVLTCLSEPQWNYGTCFKTITDLAGCTTFDDPATCLCAPGVDRYWPVRSHLCVDIQKSSC
jgi:hypothetical protein